MGLFLPLLSSECRLQFSRPWVLPLGGILLAIGLAISGLGWLELSGEDGSPIYLAGAYHSALVHGITSLGGLLVGAIVVSWGILRDDECHSAEVIQATPVPTPTLIAARLGAASLTLLALLSCCTLGLALGTLSPLVNGAHLGPFNPLHMLIPWLAFYGVGSLLVTGLFGWIAIKTRRRSMVWMGAIGAFTLASLGGPMAEMMPPGVLSALVDPMGLEALDALTQSWSVEAKNIQHLPLLSPFGLSRFLWGGVGLGLMARSTRFSFTGLRDQSAPPILKVAINSDTDAPAGIPVASPIPGGLSQVRGLLATTAFEVKHLLTSLPYLLFLGGLMAIFTGLLALRAEFGVTPQLPTSAFIAGLILRSAEIPLLLLILFFSAETLGRSRRHGMDTLLHPTPAPTLTLMLPPWVALSIGTLLPLALLSLLGLLIQGAMGETPLEPGVYLRVLSGELGPLLIFSLSLCLILQTWMANSALGIGMGALGLFLFLQLIPGSTVATPLLSFGLLRAGPFSDLNGHVAGRLMSMAPLALYWAGLTAIGVTLAYCFWPRGLEREFRGRIRRGLPRLRGPLGVVLGALALGVVILGLGIQGAVKAHGGYGDRDRDNARKAAFERAYGHLFDHPSLTITKVDLWGGLNPAAHSATFEGTYTLINNTPDPITEVFISPPTLRQATIEQLSLDGAAPAMADPDLNALEAQGYRSFRQRAPLAPGQVAKLSFKVAIPGPSLTQGSPILGNGTFLTTEQVLPTLGVRPWRLEAPAKRQAYGLRPLPVSPTSLDGADPSRNFLRTGTSGRVTFSTTLCTASDQLPLASGELIRRFEDNGARCADFALPLADGFFFAFVSGRYEIARGQAGDTPVAIYAYPGHGFNVPTLLNSLETTLPLFESRFGPLPVAMLTIAEVPYQAHAQSHLGLIAMGERLAFLTDIHQGSPYFDGPLDLASYVLAHEVAHQWFGHVLLPADAPGAEVLTESLAEYGASIAIETQYDWAMAKALRDHKRVEYLASLRDGADTPLALALGNDALTVGRGHLAFWALRHALGEVVLGEAIGELMQTFGGKGAPFPTSADLIANLKGAAKARHHGLIDAYFEGVGLWDVGLASATMEPELGEVEIEIELRDAPVTLGGDGEIFPQWVEVGLYAEDPTAHPLAEPVSLEWHRLDGPMTRLRLENKAQGARYVVVDPRGLLIEEDEGDNGWLIDLR